MNYKSPILRYHDLGQETVGNAKQLNPSFRGVAKFLQQISKNGPIFELYLLNFRVKYFFKIRAELHIYFQNVFLFEVRQIVWNLIFTNIGSTPDGQKRIPLILDGLSAIEDRSFHEDLCDFDHIFIVL